MTHTVMHSRVGNIIYKAGKRCYSCNFKIRLNGWENIADFIHKDELYCRNCYRQVSHGVKLEQFKKKEYLTEKCEKCELAISLGKKTCFKCLPQKSKEWIEKRRLIKREAKDTLNAKPPQDEFYMNTGGLRKEFALCQNVKCVDKKPTLKKDMFILTRKTDRFYVCSESCLRSFKESQIGLDFNIKLPITPSK